jgi:hypothetical protein
MLIAAANAVHTATLAETSRQRILEKRIQRLLQQAEALENQYDLSLDEGQKVVLKEKAQQIWSQIAELEKQFGAGG